MQIKLKDQKTLNLASIYKIKNETILNLNKTVNSKCLKTLIWKLKL